MKKLGLIIVCVLGVYGNINAQGNNKIIVKVDQINSSKGTVNVAIFNSEKDFLNKPYLSKVKEASPGELEFVFEGVPNGEYTVSIYQDENKNGELDKNFIGIPNEPYGVSLEGRSMFGPPNYKDAKFMLENENARLIISLD